MKKEKFMENPGLKVVSLVLATLLWAYVHFIEAVPLYSGGLR